MRKKWWRMERKDDPGNKARRCHIRRGTTRITDTDLIALIQEEGYEVIRYGTASNTPAVRELIRSLGLEEVCRERQAFSVRQGDARLVFVSDNLNAEDLRITLAHELGHLACGHMEVAPDREATLVAQEYEANEFAHHLLHPAPAEVVLNCLHRRRNRACLAAVLVLLVGIVAVFLGMWHGGYYVTGNGKKYHVWNCRYVRNSRNTRRIAVNEVELYEACNVCLPEIRGTTGRGGE